MSQMCSSTFGLIMFSVATNFRDAPPYAQNIYHSYDFLQKDSRKIQRVQQQQQTEEHARREQRQQQQLVQEVLLQQQQREQQQRQEEEQILSQQRRKQQELHLAMYDDDTARVNQNLAELLSLI